MNNGKRFSVCIQNPPYGSVGGDTLHLKFVDKCLDLAETQIVVMPFTFVTKIDHKPSKKYKEKFSLYLSEVEEVDSKYFKGTAMPNVGIYVFGDKTQDINIKYVNSTSETLTSLLDKSNFSIYERKFIQYLENQGTQEIKYCCGPNARKKHLINLTTDEQNQLKERNFNKVFNPIKQSFKSKNNPACLIVNNSNGGMNATFMSSRVGQIFTNIYDVENFFRGRKPPYNVLIFNSKIEAENCKIALQNPLLRFTCLKTQHDQNMLISCVYKYIPAVNWEDPRVKTDEGLLEVCGCPKDKCKEYADYCRKVIEEVDDKESADSR